MILIQGKVIEIFDQRDASIYLKSLRDLTNNILNEK